MYQANFDPVEVGSAEQGWWKAHNDHDIPLMTEFLIKEHKNLYSLSDETANNLLKPLVEAARYHDQDSWQLAIAKVTEYYEAIKVNTGLSFNTKEVAELEVGWWKLHDELEHNQDKTPLAEMFTNLYAKIFNIAPKDLQKAGQLKAEATHEHDLAENPQTLPKDIDKHWDKTKNLLINFYQELKSHL